MNVQVSAATAEEVASRVPPPGQQPLGKGFRQLASKSSDFHLTPAHQDGPATRERSAGEDGEASENGLGSEDGSLREECWSSGDGKASGADGRLLSGRAARSAGDHSRRSPRLIHLSSASPPRPRCQLNPLLWSSHYLQRTPSAAAPERKDQIYYQVSCQLKRYLRKSRKPPVVVVAESAESKLLSQAVCAFGSSPSLRDIANLVIAFPRVQERDEEGRFGGCPKRLLLAIDRYDLYGHIAMLRLRDPRDETNELLRIAHDHRGVLLVDGAGDADEGDDANGALIRLSSALRVPVVSADAGGQIDVQGLVGARGSADARGDSAQKRDLNSARTHALLA